MNDNEKFVESAKEALKDVVGTYDIVGTDPDTKTGYGTITESAYNKCRKALELAEGGKNESKDDQWKTMKEYFNSSANYEAKRGRDIYFFSNETDRIGHLVSRSREWDFYLTRMYAQLAFSLKKRHGIILAPYPIMNRLDDEATCLDVQIEE